MTNAKAKKLMPKNGIKITDEDAARAFFKVAFGRAEHCIDYHRALEIAGEADAELKKEGVKAAKRTGATLEYYGPGASAKSYKYPWTATYLVCRRFSDGWRIMEAEGVKRWPKEPRRLCVETPAQAAEAEKAKAMAAKLVAEWKARRAAAQQANEAA